MKLSCSHAQGALLSMERAKNPAMAIRGLTHFVNAIACSLYRVVPDRMAAA